MASAVNGISERAGEKPCKGNDHVKAELGLCGFIPRASACLTSIFGSKLWAVNLENAG